MDVYCSNCENACSERSVACPKCGHPLQARRRDALDVKPVRAIWPRLCFWAGKSLQTSRGKLSIGKATLAVGLMVISVAVIMNVEYQEFEARGRIDRRMRAQSRLLDELRARQIAQQRALERRADLRRIGGFDADTARRAQAGAQRAQDRYSQLQPQDIEAAFAIFGDIEGLSHEDLTRLAIIASFGELNVDLNRSRPDLKERADTLLRRFQERTTIFITRETLQGEGVGPAARSP